jgi:hypothetical protein
VHLDALPPVPGAPQDGGAAHVAHLLDYVQLRQPYAAVLVIGRAVERGRMLVRDVVNMAQPVVRRPVERLSGLLAYRELDDALGLTATVAVGVARQAPPNLGQARRQGPVAEGLAVPERAASPVHDGDGACTTGPPMLVSVWTSACRESSRPGAPAR